MQLRKILPLFFLCLPACSASRIPGVANDLRAPPPDAARITISGQVVARVEGASLTPVEVLVIDPPRRYEIVDDSAKRELLGLIGSQAKVSGVVDKAQSAGNAIVLDEVKFEGLEPRPPSTKRPAGFGVEANI